MPSDTLVGAQNTLFARSQWPPSSVVRRSVLYLSLDVRSGQLRDRKPCPGRGEQLSGRVTRRLARWGVCCQAGGRGAVPDPLLGESAQSTTTAAGPASCSHPSKSLASVMHCRRCRIVSLGLIALSRRVNASTFGWPTSGRVYSDLLRLEIATVSSSTSVRRSTPE